MHEKRIHRLIYGLILVAVICIIYAAIVIAQPAPFIVTGNIQNPDGSSCWPQSVYATNINTGESWSTKLSSHYFQLVLTDHNISADHILQFNISTDAVSEIFNYTISQSDIDNGGFINNFTITGGLNDSQLSPDLSIINEIIIEPEIHSHFETTIKVMITNTGITASDTFDVALLVNGELIGINPQFLIKPDEKRPVEFEWTPQDPGNHTICIRLDPDNTIYEQNEDNNNISIDATVELSTIIRVPEDHPTIQTAVDNATIYTVIFIAEGEYITDCPGIYDPDPIKPVLTISDKQHMKIIGNSHDTRIIYRTGHINPPGLDMIRIFNSSDIKLIGFTAEAKFKTEIDNSPSNLCLIAIRNSTYVSLSNLVLIHGGIHKSEGNRAIEIEESSHCTVKDNYLSGTVGKFTGNKGIYISSNNNTICYNTISRFMTCIALSGNNNTIYANNIFKSNAISVHALDSGYNYWNSRSLVSYTFNNTTLRNYIGNHFSGLAGEDINNDGIWDTPYNITEIAIDNYPLVDPYLLTFDISTAGIARPSMIYTNRNNTILAYVKRTGTYPVPEPVIANLTANGIVIDSQIISINSREYKVLRFNWTPEYSGTYELNVEIQPGNEIEEEDVTNNNLSVSVIVSSPFYNYQDNIKKALDFVNESQFPTGSISGFSNSQWAAFAIISSGEDPAVGRWKPYHQSLIGYLRNDPKDSIIGLPLSTNPPGLFNANDFSQMILVTSAIGENPMDFGGVNYLGMLKSFFDGVQFGDPDNIEDDAFAVLALVSCGERDCDMVKSAVSHIKAAQNQDGGWGAYGQDSDAEITSLVIQALIAAGEEQGSPVILDALGYLRNIQQEDGGFLDAVTTSYAIGAMIAAGDNPLTYINNGRSPVDYLMALQQDDGSFNYTADVSLFPSRTTIFPILALCGMPLPAMIKTTSDEYELTDISIGKLNIDNEVYVNTTYTISTVINNNGGIFDAVLSDDGVPVKNETIKSVWYDSIKPLTFQWKPNTTGIHNLKITVDTNNRISERYENNNEISRRIEVVLPDLYPFSLDYPAKIYVNASNTLTATIHGKTDEDFNITFKADGEVIDERVITGIDHDTNMTFEWRPSHAGKITLELIVDENKMVKESIETNNILSSSANVVFPDLFPTAMQSTLAYVNATNMINISVGGTAECFSVSLFESGAAVGNVSNITCYGSTNVSIPWKPDRTGNHTLQAVIDPYNNIRETDEANNNITKEYEVILPDILPVNITPDIIFINETNNIIVTVNGTAEGFNATLFANNTCIDKKVDLNTYNNTIEFEWTPKYPGNHNLTVLLDPDNDIIETNETNNNLSVNVITANRIGLKLLFPLGGEILTGFCNITWNASYDQPVMIDLVYSANNGYTWNTIAENITNNGSYEWDTRDVIDGKYMILIVARYANITQEDNSDLFFVYNKKSASNWGEFHSNAGFSLSETPDTCERAWISDDIGAESSSSLIVADGKIFVYCAGWQKDYSDYTYLVALNESDGTVLWGTRIAPRKYFSWATPTYNDGRVYVSSGDGVYCIDATKEDRGHVLWEYTFPDGGGSVNGGPAVANGKVYVGSWGGGHYYCLDAKKGTMIWKFKINDNSQSVPAIAYGRVYFGDFSGNSKAYCVDMDDAYEFWNTSIDWNACGSFTVSDGAVYFTTYNFFGPGCAYALDAGNGTQIWKNNIISTDSTPAFYAPSGSTRSYVYVSAGFGAYKIYCFNIKNGETVWTVDGLGHWTNSPAVSIDKKVFVGKKGGGGGMISGYSGLYCLDALTGDEIWHSDIGGSSPAIANGKVYTIAGNRVVAFGSSTLPDLTVESIFVPRIINAGIETNITARIGNIGTSDIQENFTVELRHKNDPIDKITISSLEAGNATNISFNWTPPGTGIYRLMVEADKDNTVTESGLSHPMNNWLTKNVTVGGMPDLVVTAIEAPYVSPVGSDINITVYVENTGLYTDMSFNVGLMINGEVEGNKTITLTDNKASVLFNWTSEKTGLHVLKCTADVSGIIDEAYETNNIMIKKIKVLDNSTLGLGPGYGGGTGGGSGGGIGAGDSEGDTGEAGTGGMQKPDEGSESILDKMESISGYLFTDSTSGQSGGGGTIPLLLALFLIIMLVLLYHGHRSERRLLDEARDYIGPYKRFFKKKK
jgi:subtilase family serine protease/outer membrane protein assembly factor BamB